MVWLFFKVVGTKIPSFLLDCLIGRIRGSRLELLRKEIIKIYRSVVY